MTAQMQAISDAAENAWAYVLFCFVVLSLYAWTMVVLLFVGLFLRGVWRWLTRHSMNDVVRSLEIRAFRGAKR